MSQDVQGIVKEIWLRKAFLVGLMQRREEESASCVRREIKRDLNAVWNTILEDRSGLICPNFATGNGAGLYFDPSADIARLVLPRALEIAISYRLVESGRSTWKDAVLEAGVRLGEFQGHERVEALVREYLTGKKGYVPGIEARARLFPARVVGANEPKMIQVPEEVETEAQTNYQA